jgi:heme/copper-type cytochrome/quinol oxidase subunit 2
VLFEVCIIKEKFNDMTEGNSEDLRTEDFLTGYVDNDIDEIDRMKFAKLILLFLFIIVIFVFFASYIFTAYYPDNEKLDSIINSILDITKTAVPSIVTLVLGFYFGRKD